MRDIEVKVEHVLYAYPETRDNDAVLYECICSQYYGLNTDTISLHDYLIQRNELGYPKWESVTRARRKVQEANPDLRAATYEARHAKQEQYRAYARGELA